MLPILTKHIACLGWHVELSMELRALRGCERMLRSLSVPVVLEHLGRTAPGHKGGLAALLRLLQFNNFWVKLLPPAASIDRLQTEDAVKTARQVVEARPDRILWGSDWPHILDQTTSPPACRLASFLFECTHSATIAQLVLTENPMRLYGLSNDSHIRW
jgi:predicted TIM-barrel fold metal-dependent hydrolase